jgi:hypothetical protein
MTKKKPGMLCTITIDLFKGLKKIVSIGILVDSPTRRVGESFFDYEYLREYEAQIGTARNYCKESMPNRFLQKPQKIRQVVFNRAIGQKIVFVILKGLL